MRFLCLPGMGTNAQILELQLSAITSKLPSQHDFVYVNGDARSDPGQGIGGIFKGPYFSFWQQPTPDQLNAAIDVIEDAIDEEGPFDIILGYSQGAGMAATYLIQDARSSTPHHHFKGAIFINANMPFDPDSRLFKSKDGSFVWDDSGSAVDFDVSRDYPEADDIRYGPLHALQDNTAICQRFQPAGEPWIPIPTIHIVGDADELYRSQAYRLHQLCDPARSKVVDYRGTHSIPSDIINSSKIARGIESFVHQIVVG